MNIETYFDNYDFEKIFNEILKENKIEQMSNMYDRHKQELKKFSEKIRIKYKQKNYFQDLPTLNDDFSSYVIVTNTPFVEEAKREKF